MISECIKHFFEQESLLADIFQTVAYHGAASAPLLSIECRKQLLVEVEARSFIFTAEAREQGTEGMRVYQELETFIDFTDDSAFVLLRDVFEVYLDNYADTLLLYPFSHMPLFNSCTLARYPAGSIGITPHRDPLRYKNLICIFILEGNGKFFLCRDRSGQNAQEIVASAGNIIFLRAPGFMGINTRPFHFVTRIDTMRYTFALRQEGG